MTNEEAIKELKILREDYWDEYGDTMPALDMAIKALEQQSEDAISRAETVQFLTNHSNDFEDAKIRMALRAASSLVNNPHNLPPVQPKIKTGHWIHLKHNKGKCSECHDVVLIAQMYGNANYCPNCGARMIEPQAESEEA